MSARVVRPLALTDSHSARGLVGALHGGTRYLARTMELLELAVTQRDPECRGLVAHSADSVLEGIVLYGTVSGAMGALEVHELLGVTEGALRLLLETLSGVDCSRGARLIVCELARSPEHAPASAALLEFGFTCEASIADYFADGITLDILVHRP